MAKLRLGHDCSAGVIQLGEAVSLIKYMSVHYSLAEES